MEYEEQKTINIIDLSEVAAPAYLPGQTPVSGCSSKHYCMPCIVPVNWYGVLIKKHYRMPYPRGSKWSLINKHYCM